MKARIPNAGGQGNMMKQIQKMQEDMQKMQAEVEASEFTAYYDRGNCNPLLCYDLCCCRQF